MAPCLSIKDRPPVGPQQTLDTVRSVWEDLRKPYNYLLSNPLEDVSLWAAIRSVERNPVKAHIVSQAEAYVWSNANAHSIAPGLGSVLDFLPYDRLSWCHGTTLTDRIPRRRISPDRAWAMRVRTSTSLTSIATPFWTSSAVRCSSAGIAMPIAR